MPGLITVIGKVKANRSNIFIDSRGDINLQDKLSTVIEVDAPNIVLDLAGDIKLLANGTITTKDLESSIKNK